MREFLAVGHITSGSDREIQEPSSSRSIQGESSREEGNFIGIDLIRFGGFFLVCASDSSSDSISNTCYRFGFHANDWACIPLI
jgi:hypothetical protein